MKMVIDGAEMRCGGCGRVFYLGGGLEQSRDVACPYCGAMVPYRAEEPRAVEPQTVEVDSGKPWRPPFRGKKR